MLKPTPRVNPPDAESERELTLRDLFDVEESPLLRYAFALVGRRAVAEDIVQEVFLQLHVRWDEVTSPRKWLYRSVRNRAFNHVRNRRREVLGHDHRESTAADDETQSVEAMIEQAEVACKVRQVLNELDEADRKLVQLKNFEGQKYREISDETGMSIGNVGYRLHHLLKELASKLNSQGVHE